MAMSTVPKMGCRLAPCLLCPLVFGCGWIDFGGDQAIGRPCQLPVDAGPSQGVHYAAASECPSKLCLKPSVQPGASTNWGTGPSCSGECDKDDDCKGETRDTTNPSDTRCANGFACGIPFVKGPLCCKKLCVCKDFLGPQELPTPIACQGEGAATCSGSAGEPLESSAAGVEQQTDVYISIAPVRQLDLVTMVDNSPNMAPKIEKLNAQFPKLIDALKDPTDGTLPDLRVAIIDSDLGTAGAYATGACAPKTLADGMTSEFGDIGRFRMPSFPMTCPFTPGSLFLENKSGLPLNYTGDISAVFSCLTGNLGMAGCEQEHQLQAFEFALVAKGVGNETQQAAFLRPTAQLGLLFLTDEDDCSAAVNDRLFGDKPELRGESTSLRCATRAHKCNGQNLTTSPPGFPTTAPFAAPFSACQARIGDECGPDVDTSQPTTCNPLRSIRTIADGLKSLKANSDQVLVAGIFGWPLSDTDMASAAYRIARIPNPNTTDTANPTIYDYWPVCYDPNHLPSPTTTDPATGFDATAAAWGATGGLRESAFVDQFGANGMKFSICAPDFSNSMESIGRALARRLQSLCFDDKLVDADPATVGIQADCRVVWRIPVLDPKSDMVTYAESPTSLPQCAAGSTNGNVPMDCWQLTSDPTQCPGSGQRIAVLRTRDELAQKPQLDPGTKVLMECRTCPALPAGSAVVAGCDY
jgi:hypothetical protein